MRLLNCDCFCEPQPATTTCPDERLADAAWGLHALQSPLTTQEPCYCHVAAQDRERPTYAQRLRARIQWLHVERSVRSQLYLHRNSQQRSACTAESLQSDDLQVQELQPMLHLMAGEIDKQFMGGTFHCAMQRPEHTCSAQQHAAPAPHIQSTGTPVHTALRYAVVDWVPLHVESLTRQQQCASSTCTPPSAFARYCPSVKQFQTSGRRARSHDNHPPPQPSPGFAGYSPTTHCVYFSTNTLQQLTAPQPAQHRPSPLRHSAQGSAQSRSTGQLDIARGVAALQDSVAAVKQQRRLYQRRGQAHTDGQVPPVTPTVQLQLASATDTALRQQQSHMHAQQLARRHHLSPPSSLPQQRAGRVLVPCPSLSWPVCADGWMVTSRLQLVLHVLAHEMVHAVAEVMCPMASKDRQETQAQGHGPLFARLSRRLFGHIPLDGVGWGYTRHTFLRTCT